MKAGFGNWFRGLKGKLLFAACLPIVGFVGLTAVSFHGIGKFDGMMKELNNVIIPNAWLIGEMRQARNKFAYGAWVAIAEKNNPARRDIGVKMATEGATEYAKSFKEYLDAPMALGEEPIDSKYKAISNDFMNMQTKIQELLASGDMKKYDEAEGMLVGKDYDHAYSEVKQYNAEVLKLYSDQAQADKKEGDETKSFVSNLQLLMGIFSGLAIFGALILIAAKITKSVGSITERLTEAGGQVATAVEQLNGAGNNLSQSSVEAAASLEETVASLEELSSMVKLNAEHAKEAATLSISSRDSAEKGEKQIQNLIQSMTQISQSSKKIEEIISVIDDIAFQTNLLALNAAVEAARAGEQGKGFAVVAEAVRALAQRSAAAAKDITTLIQDSVSQIDGGSKIADQSGAVLTNIVTSVKKVSDLNNEISQASSEQSNGIQQISNAMNQLDQASQANAASAEEIAATSTEISKLAVTAQNLNIELGALIMGTAAESLETPTSKVTSTPRSMGGKKPMTATPSNVIPMPTKPHAKKSKGSEMIPFEEDVKKVGTTDGF